MQQQRGVRVQQQIADRRGHPGGQRQRPRGPGHVGLGDPVRRELIVDLRFHRRLDQHVAGQPEVDGTQYRRRGEQIAGGLRGLALRVMEAARGPPGETGMAWIVVVAGGRVELGVGTAEGTGAAVLASAAASIRRARAAWLVLRVAARWNSAAASLQPPRRRARSPARSSSAAVSSSGPVPAWARCQARWSGRAEPMAAARLAWTRCRSAKVAP